MIEFSAEKFITTLINIITDSPTSILFIILGIVFTIAMIINVKKNKTIGKSLFIIGWIFIVLFIIIKYNGYISKMFDNLVNNVFMQIFFPNLATYIIIIIITNIIFLKTILNKSTKTSTKIVNSIFFSLIMVLMVYTLDIIIENKINIYDKAELYTNKKALTLIEATTILFSSWVIIILSKMTIKKLINKSNEKIIEENKESKQIDETQTTTSTPESPEVASTISNQDIESTSVTNKENATPIPEIINTETDLIVQEITKPEITPENNEPNTQITVSNKPEQPIQQQIAELQPEITGITPVQQQIVEPQPETTQIIQEITKPENFIPTTPIQPMQNTKSVQTTDDTVINIFNMPLENSETQNIQQ